MVTINISALADLGISDYSDFEDRYEDNFGMIQDEESVHMYGLMRGTGLVVCYVSFDDLPEELKPFAHVGNWSSNRIINKEFESRYIAYPSNVTDFDIYKDYVEENGGTITMYDADRYLISFDGSVIYSHYKSEMRGSNHNHAIPAWDLKEAGKI